MNGKNGGEKNRRVEALKNGLLSYALNKVKKDDFDHLNFAYQKFDGTKLPSMSGHNMVNACISYIIDKQEFKKTLFYTPHMESKLDAIDKYLENNFDTDTKVIDFMEAFINDGVE